jgi:2-C-methyl-D-erythritol 4-phosphate cytidylyltransferase
MRKFEWKAKIEAACEAAGTYKECFDSVIDTLAGIMETRDDAQEQFEQLGGKTVVEHAIRGGQINTVKNPALVVLMDCNAQALAYWRDLGLTPAGLKKINEGAIRQEKKESALEKALANFEG